MLNSDTTSVPAQDDDDEINLLDLLQVVVDNLRLLVLAPLAAGLLALGITFAIAPTFTATTVITQRAMPRDAANPSTQPIVSFLKSESIANELIDRFKLAESDESKSTSRTDARNTLGAASNISLAKDGLVTIEVSHTDPEIASNLANAYVDKLIKMLNQLAPTQAQSSRTFYENQLADIKEKSTLAEQALRTSNTPGSALKSNIDAAVSAVAVLQAKILAQEINLDRYRGYLTESHPSLQLAQSELAILRAQLVDLERSSPANAGADAAYAANFRNVQYFETLFELFSTQLELAKVDEAREGAVIQVVDVATPPERKSKPNKALIAVLSTLASGMLLLLFVFIRQALRGAAQTPETAEKITALRRAWAKALGRPDPSLRA